MKDNFLGLDHTALAADDPESLCKWYCRIFGYEVVDRTRRGTYLLRAVEGTFMEITPKDENPRQTRTQATPGWSHAAFRVKDMDVAIACLDKIGVKWLTDVFTPLGGGKLRNLSDPEGNLIQIIQR